MKVFCMIWLFLSIVTMSVIADDVEPRYDGKWWLSLTDEEKIAFFSGDFDCYVFDAKAKQHSNKPVTLAVKQVSEYYKLNPDEQEVEIHTIFRKLFTDDIVKQITGVDRHAYYDGDFWRQSFKAERVAFIRGYLDCRSAYLHSTVSKPAQYYVDEVSNWYGIIADDEPNNLSEKTGKDKIGDVIVRLLDDKAETDDPVAQKKWWQKIFIWNKDKK